MIGDPFACPARPVTGCLSPAGIRQAEAARAMLATAPVDRAFSSPYGRALQTAEIVLNGRNVPLHILDCLREWQPNGALRDTHPTEHERIMRHHEDAYVEETWKTDLGEGCFDMYARVCPPFLKELDQLGVHHRMGGYVLDDCAHNISLAVFAHGGSLNVLLCFLMEIPPFPLAKFDFALTGVAQLTFVERKGIYYPRLCIPARG